VIWRSSTFRQFSDQIDGVLALLLVYLAIRVLVGLDISAAFDTINHVVLLKLLKEWFGFWLSQRLTSIHQTWLSFLCCHAMRHCRHKHPSWVYTIYFCLLHTHHRSVSSSSHSAASVDDTQLYISMNAGDTAPALSRLTRCSTAVQQWFLQNNLQLNAGKSNVILLAATQLRSVADVTNVNMPAAR